MFAHRWESVDQWRTGRRLRGNRGHFRILWACSPLHDHPRERSVARGKPGPGVPTTDMTKNRILAAVLAAIALLASACGGSTKESDADKFASTAEQQAKTLTSAAATSTSTPTATKVAPSAGEKDISTKPDIPKQSGAPPKTLKIEDLITGTGPAAKSGDKISVRYVGELYDTGKEFDSSWKRGKAPFDVTLGQGQVIQGWDQGLVGMKVGGRRRLTIPPDLAYGPQGQPPSIPANATLVFDVDLTKIG